MSVICCLASARRCLSSRSGIELRSSVGTEGSSSSWRCNGPGPVHAAPGWTIEARPGLDEHVLPFRLMPGDGEVAMLRLLAIAVAAAAQLEFGADLIERPAVLCRNRARRHVDTYLDAPRLAAFPVAQSEFLFQVARKVIGQVEVCSVSDGSEAKIEAPVTADALPQPALELDAETDLEGLFALDDGVLRVLVVVDDIAVPVCLQVPFGRQEYLRKAVKIFFRPTWGLCGGFYGGFCHGGVSFAGRVTMDGRRERPRLK